MKKTQLDFLRALCEAQTPSGQELEGQRLVSRYVKSSAENVSLDPLGNLHCVCNAKAKFRVMIDAHCDENGLLVQYIDKKGFLYFTLVGGVNKQLLPGERVRLLGPNGPVAGVIGRKPIHLMSPRERESGVGELTELWIDIGAADQAEAKAAAPIGTYGTVESGFRPLLGDRVSARALDDRCGVFVVMEALRRLAAGKRKPRVACHFVSATQEELGLLGAKVAAYGIDPGLGVSVDVTFATDDPRSDPKSVGDIRVGGGPVLGVGPNYDPAVVDMLRAAARKAKIPVQIQPRSRGNGTNAFAVRHSRAGVPVAQLSIPLRYMHSAVEVVSLSDLDRAAELLAVFLADLPAAPKVGWRL